MKVELLGLLPLVVWSACGDDTDTDVVDTDEPNGCQNAIEQDDLFPQIGATDVYYRMSAVRVPLAVEDPTASLTLATAAGAPVAGTSSVEGESVVYTLEGPLTPETAYLATLTYECGVVEIDFTTSDTGTPLEVDVTGKVYEVALTDGLWLEPAGIGPALATLTANAEVLVSPTVSAGAISFIGGLGTGANAQNVCAPTFDLAGAAFEDPYFELTSPLLPLEVAGVTVNIEDLTLSGAFAPDGSSMDGVVLIGTVDTRPIAAVFPGGSGQPDAVCVVAASVGATCEPCVSDNQPFCLSVRVENLPAPEIPGATLVARDQATIDADPACAEPAP